MSESIVKIRDVVYPRFRVPDLDAMESFLADFGLWRSERTQTALYMRGEGEDHHVHVSERGEPGLIGFAFLARSMADLETLSAADGASEVHAIEEPGGGHRVTIRDPYGFVVELVHGIEPAPPRAERSLGLNLGRRVERRGEVKRVSRRPARIQRLGHVGLNVADPDAAFDWYHAHFGLLKSDSVALGGTHLAHFCRCDRGPEHTDHHTFLLARSPDGSPDVNHVSFEVCDLDEIWLGHEHLAERGHRHTWGIGRHTLGSQIFDYWRDPWGQIHEHFTDGDLLDADQRPGVHSPEGVASQWGPQMPGDFGRTQPG